MMVGLKDDIVEPELTRSMIDKLGERLRHGSRSEEDLRLLELYRSSFSPSVQMVQRILSGQSLVPHFRATKTPQSIIRKLIRNRGGLSRMQDIAGCRFVVPDLAHQLGLREALLGMLGGKVVKELDRRSKPSHGYRAIHLIVSPNEKPIEIQIRTELQDLWATLSEILSDRIDPEIKYGGGPAKAKALLAKASDLVREHESEEEEHIEGELLRGVGSDYLAESDKLNRHDEELEMTLDELQAKLEANAVRLKQRAESIKRTFRLISLMHE